MKTIAIVATLALALSSTALFACSPSETNARPAATATTTTTSSAGAPTQLDGLRFAASGALPNGRALSSELSFAQGMFDSTACHQFGYAAARYSVTREGDAVLFRSEMRSKDGAVETWSGRIVGDKVSATVTGPDGVAIAFSGTAH